MWNYKPRWNKGRELEKILYVDTSIHGCKYPWILFEIQNLIVDVFKFSHENKNRISMTLYSI